MGRDEEAEGPVSPREFVTNRGTRYRLPLFLPVYQRREEALPIADWEGEPEVEGLMVNAFLLYKQREVRTLLTTECCLADYVAFDGMLVTDSGAFQGFTRRLFLSNKDIVRFQDRIGSDVISPLDVVTPPGDTHKVAEGKLRATEKRIREALSLAERGVVAGVQQGGRFLDLRQESICRLVEMGVGYVAIGSLVPFFTANHNLQFVGKVLREARSVAGPELPIHVYGAGDPCELPFLVALGADIFDSASYARFAQGGWYMTPYGALSEASRALAGEYRCECPFCGRRGDVQAMFGDVRRLQQHNLWTILRVVRTVREQQMRGMDLSDYLAQVLEVHMRWFPGSALRQSWEARHG